MNQVIVGDAETQPGRLPVFGFGESVLINEVVDALSRSRYWHARAGRRALSWKSVNEMDILGVHQLFE